MKLSVQAMDTLNQHNKSNVVYNMPKIMALKRPNSEESLIPLNQMTWGLLQYQVDFFACTHTNQVISLSKTSLHITH